MPWCASHFWSPTGQLGDTRFSMLETIRQFAEEQLVQPARPTTARTAHARYFAGREADVLGPVGRSAATRGLHVVHRRTGQPACRVPMGR